METCKKPQKSERLGIYEAALELYKDKTKEPPGLCMLLANLLMGVEYNDHKNGFCTYAIPWSGWTKEFLNYFPELQGVEGPGIGIEWDDQIRATILESAIKKIKEDKSENK